MESIALGYLDIEDPVIKNIKHENRDNAEAFNREIIRNWMHRNPEPNQVQALKSKLLKAAKECSYVDPQKVEEILVGCETSSAAAATTLSANKVQVTEDELETLADNMKPYTEQTMQIERAPWLPEDSMDMDDLYTQLTLEQLCNKPKGPTGIKIDDYKDLFGNKVLIKTQTVSHNKSQIGNGPPAKKMCTKRSRKKIKKVLLKGEWL